MKRLSKFAISAVALISLAFTPAVARTFTFTGTDGIPVSIDIDDSTDTGAMIVSLIEQNETAIQTAIDENGITSAQIEEGMPQINEAITEFENQASSGDSSNGMGNPIAMYKNATTALNGVSSTLLDSISVSQTAQNQWAQAYIGKIFPGFHIGAGINASVGTWDITPLNTFLTSMDMEAVNPAQMAGLDGGSLLDNKIAFPSIAADLRIGGIFLPFDLGCSVMALNTADIDALNSMLADYQATINYLSWSFDLRYAFVNLNGPINTNLKVSATAGLYHTQADLAATIPDMGDVGFIFDVTTLAVGAQASAKFLVFVPYLGGKVLFTQGKANWSLSPDWNTLLGGSSSDGFSFATLLPATVSGESTCDFFATIRPQVFGGLGIDLWFVDITAGVNYTFVSFEDMAKNVLGGFVSVRLAWD